METRTREVKDAEGNTRTETYEERVNTHHANEPFEFSEWVDKSPPVEAMEHIDVFLLCRLYTHKIINYSSKAWGSYQQQREQFIERNWKDEKYEYHLTEDIPF